MKLSRKDRLLLLSLEERIEMTIDALECALVDKKLMRHEAKRALRTFRARAPYLAVGLYK